MSDKPAAKPPIDEIPLCEPSAATAPFVYFDAVPNFGINNGVANLTLEAVIFTSVDNVMVRQRVVVAHLRMAAHGLENLKNAIEGIELLAKPAPTARPN